MKRKGTILYGNGEAFSFKVDSENVGFLLMAGKKLNEPIVSYGPFVMNTEKEIQKAISEYQNNTFVKHKEKEIIFFNDFNYFIFYIFYF